MRWSCRSGVMSPAQHPGALEGDRERVLTIARLFDNSSLRALVKK